MAYRLGYGQDVLLELGGKAQQVHDLRDPGPGDVLAAGAGRLVGGAAEFQQGLLLAGLAEEPDHPEGLRPLGRVTMTQGWGAVLAGVHGPVAPLTPWVLSPLIRPRPRRI